jgi:hypothetical protein
MIRRREFIAGLGSAGAWPIAQPCHAAPSAQGSGEVRLAMAGWPGPSAGAPSSRVNSFVPILFSLQEESTASHYPLI